MCEELEYPEIVKTRFASVYLAFLIATLKHIVLSEDNFFEKTQYISEIENDPHLKQVLSKINLKIENKNRKLIRSLLLHRNTLMCYLILLIRYKYLDR